MPPLPSWNQAAADRYLAACEAVLALVTNDIDVEQLGLDRLARDQWRGSALAQFEHLVARRDGANADLLESLRAARVALQRASAEAPGVILAATLQAMPFAPGSG